MEGGSLPSDEEAALTEAEEAIEHVQSTGEAIELAPQNSFVRLQHQPDRGVAGSARDGRGAIDGNLAFDMVG